MSSPGDGPASAPRPEGREGKLHFLVIGAQKSGTTSLHKYLERHPQLYMLPEKEVPFFTNEAYRAKGWAWFAENFFREARPGERWGKSTPHYMTDLAVPARIFEEMPGVKLIALLRNPVDRAFSHYKMMVKRERESRSFAEVVAAKLEPAAVQRDRAFPPGTSEDGYFVMGEYSLILKAYLERFPREQLLVLFTEDLKRDPAATMQRLATFLEIDDSFIPDNLGKLYHVGGTRRRIPLAEHDLAKHGVFRKLLKLVPKGFRSTFERRFLFWYMIWNTKPDPEAKMPADLRERLVAFYREDVAKLESLLGQAVPWPEFRHASGQDPLSAGPSRHPEAAAPIRSGSPLPSE